MAQARRGRAGRPRRPPISGARRRHDAAPRAALDAPRPRRGFTYVELLVTLGILAALIGLLLPLVGKSRASAQSVTCMSQLRQVGAAFLQYAADNDQVLPDPFNVQRSWEQLLRPYLQDDGVYRCAADNELYPSIGSSYDWRDTGRPDTTLAGKSISDVPLHSNPVLAFEALPGWHAQGRINVVMLNGSGHSLSEEAYLVDVHTPLRGPVLVPAPKAPPGKGAKGGP